MAPSPTKLFYFNDLRHWWIYALEPPLSPEEVVLPVQEVAGVVDAVMVQVDGGSGLWYPSKAGRTYLRNAPASLDADVSTVEGWAAESSINWRAWQSLATLARDGCDPLLAMRDCARTSDTELHASLRMGNIPDMDPSWVVANASGEEFGGKGLAEPAMRQYQFAVTTPQNDIPNSSISRRCYICQGYDLFRLVQVLKELLLDYDLDGVELDFACPGGTAWFFPKEDGLRYAPLLTELLADVAGLRKPHNGSQQTLQKTVGVHVYPTEEMNLRHGLDVRRLVHMARTFTRPSGLRLRVYLDLVVAGCKFMLILICVCLTGCRDWSCVSSVGLLQESSIGLWCVIRSYHCL